MGVYEERAGEGFRQVQEVASRSADLPQQCFAWKPDCNSPGSSSGALRNRSRQTCGVRPWRRQLKFAYRTSSGAAWTRPAAKTGHRSPDRRSRGTWSAAPPATAPLHPSRTDDDGQPFGSATEQKRLANTAYDQGYTWARDRGGNPRSTGNGQRG